MALGKIKVKSVLNGFRSPGVIYLQDGKTKDKEVVCQEGILVKDILDRVCSSLEITPVARFFFTLCNPKSCFPLNPYHRLTQEEAKKQYQLRVYVNTRENSLQFQKLCPRAYAYYYEQLKEDFIADRLYPRATLNTALWMAAIDIAREAHSRGKTFSELIPREISKFMSSFLSKKYATDKRIQDKVNEVFHRFHTLEEPNEDHFKWKYVEVYEKDRMCGQHIFRIRESAGFGQKGQEILLVVSLSEGIYKTSKEEDESSKQVICSIKAVKSLKVVLTQATAHIEYDMGQDGQENIKTIRLSFTDKKELVSFAVVVQGYHKLFVDANSLILGGDLQPPEECLLVGMNDGRRQNLCHGPISPRSAEGILRAFGLEEGLFLVRESRNVDNAFTLSLCHSKQVLNFRIQRNLEGKFSFEDPPDQEEKKDHVEFPTLYHLIEQHKNMKNGLPTLLKRNLAPDVTHMVPLLPTVDDGSDGTASLILRGDISDGNSVSASSGPPTPTSPRQHSEVVQQLIEENVPFINYSELETCSELGSGHYSTVYLATWKNKGVEQKVAVKIPSMHSSNVEAVKKDLKREIKTMSSLHHPNVVKLLGISESHHYLSFIDMIPVVIMEFVEGGSLRGHLDNLRKNLTPEVKTRSKTEFLDYGIQIAEGMKYLEERKVVHRDLAARNVLLEAVSRTIKISDFGLARQRLEDQDYYKGNLGSNDLPIYWYAPECLRSLKFDTKGDVWSYGVTLWEVFTYGEYPTKQLSQVVRGLSAKDAFTKLADVYRNGFRLERGYLCQNAVYSIILKCWQYDSKQRPTFDALVTELKELLRKIQAVSNSTANNNSPIPRTLPVSPSPQQQTTPTSPSPSSTVSVSSPS